MGLSFFNRRTDAGAGKTEPAATPAPAQTHTSGAVASDFKVPHGGVVDKASMLPPNYVILSGAKARDKLSVTDHLLRSVAVVAYPAENVAGCVRYFTLRLGVAGWNDSPDNIRHNIAINAELNELGARNNIKLEPSRPFEASRALIAEINGIPFDEQDVSVTTDTEVKSIMRDQAAREAQATNPYNLMVQELINAAVKLGTADIHVYVRYDKDKTTRANRSLVQFRIDGELVTMDDLSPKMKDPRELRGMIGFMWNELCDNRSEPAFHPGNFLEAMLKDRQVGPNSETIRGRFKTFDLGDASAPNGDKPFKLVLRIIYVDRNAIPTLTALGFFPDAEEALVRFINNHKRLLCISGKVNMGKSTTLRSVYAMVPASESKYSVEEPIENTHPNTAQINVSTAAAMELVLKGLKRGDLDSLLMGEVRSRETLEMVINIVLSGHPCFTTTHSDSALGQIAYFMTPQMGMDSGLLAHSAVLGLLLHQVLIRKLCSCALTGSSMLESLGLVRLRHIEKTYNVDINTFRAHNPDGCPVCRAQGHVSRIGYAGRHVIAEFIEPNIEDRLLIEKRDFATLERSWRESHGRYDDFTVTKGHTVQEVGLKACLQGVADVRSVERYCGRFVDAGVISSPPFVPAIRSVAPVHSIADSSTNPGKEGETQ